MKYKLIPIYARKKETGKSFVVSYAKVDSVLFEKVSKYRWNIDRAGYVFTSTWNKKEKKQVRLWMSHLIMNRKQKGKNIDHINRDKSDNRKRNLRFVTHFENCLNRSKPIGKTGYRGILRFRNQGTWVARVRIKNGTKTIKKSGFLTPRAAALAYDVMAKKLHGKFAVTNRSLGLL